MDLALEFGMTAKGLGRVMTKRELERWRLYAGRRMLPGRRVELLLAQIAMLIAQTMGGNKEARLTDFLFDPMDDDDGADVADVFGFNPLQKG